MEHKPIAIIILPIFVMGILILGTMAATGNAQESSNTGTAAGDCVPGPGTTCELVVPASGEDQNTILAIHNRERAAVHVPDLVWSDSLAADARNYLDKMVFENNGVIFKSDAPRGVNLLRHASDLVQLGQGENLARLAQLSSHPNMVERLVQDWVSEKPSMGQHYTQMVWKTTKEVGCAIATVRGTTESGMGNGKIPAVAVYLNCRYSPSGNTGGPPY
ncbi:MAG: hypothetical protein JO297_05705 [Nitrososphaeraceae archaeon]|nr:hypothetical protein [Nitrososphaeraceae archaeon]